MVCLGTNYVQWDRYLCRFLDTAPPAPQPMGYAVLPVMAKTINKTIDSISDLVLIIIGLDCNRLKGKGLIKKIYIFDGLSPQGGKSFWLSPLSMFKKKLFVIKIPLIIGAPPKKNIFHF